MSDNMSDDAFGLAVVVIFISVVLVACLGFVKVRNELQMTREYHAQAVALERIADALGGRR